MPVAKITGQGLTALALAVALLWACWIATRVTMDRSLVERARILRDLERLQRRQHPEPVSVPFPHRPHNSEMTAG